MHKNHNHTLSFTELSAHNHFFIMVAYPGHILESTIGIEIEVGTYIVQTTRTIILSYSLLALSPSLFIKRLFSLSCLGVQVMFNYKFWFV